MTNDFKNSVIEAYSQVINEDHSDFLSSVLAKFSNVNIGNLKIKVFTESDLEIFKIEKIIVVETPIKIKKKRKPHSLPIDGKRCMARTWGGDGTVNCVDGKWICGYQCKRTKKEGTDYCGIHNKQIIKKKCLTHGRIDEDVPHDHYEKYKTNE